MGVYLDLGDPFVCPLPTPHQIPHLPFQVGHGVLSEGGLDAFRGHPLHQSLVRDQSPVEYAEVSGQEKEADGCGEGIPKHTPFLNGSVGRGRSAPRRAWVI